MSESQATGTLAVYSDYVCPFCYLGRASLTRYRERRTEPLEVAWRPFDLRGRKRRRDGTIDDSVDDGKDEDYYKRARRNVQRLADRYDVEMQLDLADDVDSWHAHLVGLHLRREHDEGTFRDFHHATFDALWRDGRDIGEPAVLEDLAADVGVEPDVVEMVLEEDDLENELRAQFAEATERGVTAVPTFVYDDHAARGAVPPEQLERLVEGD